MSSTTGARDPVTSALHIILGDSMPLDIVRMTGWNKCPEDELDEKPKVQYAASFTGWVFVPCLKERCDPCDVLV
jgi:ceramide kinase